MFKIELTDQALEFVLESLREKRDRLNPKDEGFEYNYVSVSNLISALGRVKEKGHE